MENNGVILQAEYVSVGEINIMDTRWSWYRRVERHVFGIKRHKRHLFVNAVFLVTKPVTCPYVDVTVILDDCPSQADEPYSRYPVRAVRPHLHVAQEDVARSFPVADQTQVPEVN